MASSSPFKGTHPEQAVLESTQHLLQATLDASLDMIQVFQAVRNDQGELVDFRWVLNNHAAEKIYGDVVGKSLLEFQPGVVDEGIFAAFKQVVETGEPQQYEKHYVHEQFDGWFYQSVVKLNDGVATTTTDITGRKRAQEQLQQSQAFLQSVIDSSLDVIQVFKAVRDETGSIVDFVWVMNNRKAVAQNGSVIGKSLLQRNPGVLQTGIFDHMVEVAQTGLAYEHEQFYDYEQFKGWFYQALVKTDDGVAMTTRDISRQKQADEELRRLNDEIAQKATDKYRILFETIDEGFCVQELVFDQHGEVADLIYHEANQAFGRHTGLAEVNGKRASEVFPLIEPGWFRALKRVHQTGVPERTEGYNADTQRWLTAHYSPIGGAGSPFIAAVFQDITERKRREAHQQLLIDIAGDLSRLSNEQEIVRTVGAKLAAHLMLDCYHYVDVDEDQAEVTIRYFWHAQDVPYILGTYPIEGFVPPSGLKNRRAGKTDVVNDVQSDLPGDTAATIALKAGAAAQRIGAYVVVPYSRDGAWNAYFAVADSQPRRWTNLDIELIEEVASRLFPRIERVRAEAALRQSEEKYRTLFDSIDEGFNVLELLVDEQGKPTDCRILQTNRVWHQQTGLSEAVGRTLREVMPTVEPQLIEFYADVARSGRAVRFEYYTESVGRWYTAFATRIGGAESRQVAIVFDDITERKARDHQQAFLLRFSDSLRIQPNADALANRALQLLAEQLQLDRCYIGVYQLAEDRADITHQVGNNRVSPMPDSIRLSDFPDAFQIVFEGTLVIDDVDKTEGLTELDRQNMDALGFSALVAATLRQGEHQPLWAIVAVSAAPRRWTSNEIGLVEEVTERTWAAMERARTEEALRASEKRFRLAIEATELGTWEWNLLTDEVYWNEQHFRLFGMEPHANPIGPEVFFDHVHPDERPRITALLQQVIAERGVYDTEFLAVLDDGSERWMRGYGRIVEEVAGQPARMSGVMFDIDERRRAEDALREADRRKDEFLALLAHELRNPLAPVRNGLQLLIQTHTDDPMLGTLLPIMNRQMDHLLRLVDDLLDVSRISQGKLELHKQRIDLTQVVAQTVGAMQPLYTASGRQLSAELPDHPLYLDGDATRLNQIVTNLLTNGLRFTHEGGQVWLNLEQVGEQARLRVSDNGIGLAADQLTAIFELFVQVDTSLARSHGGLGLGLALVQQLVTMHGGRVEAHSRGLEQGSEFRVYLPILVA